MKPSFALDLSQEKLALLHRTGQGWVSVGEVALDDPALDQRLAMLRRTATGLAPHGLATKLILPASQILYTEVEAPGPDRASRRRQIADALEGLTPYGREDLAFDWSRNGRRVQVAAVARLTLREAEDFAEAHRFNPVCFVAIPEPGQFAGEPFFGQTGRAAAILPAGERLDRDQDPVRIIAAAAPPRGTQAAARPSANAAAVGATDTACASEAASAAVFDATAMAPEADAPASVRLANRTAAEPAADQPERLSAALNRPATLPDTLAGSDPLADLPFQSRRPVIASAEAAMPPAPGPGADGDSGATLHLDLPDRLDLARPETGVSGAAAGVGPVATARADGSATDADFAAGLGVTAPIVPIPARVSPDDDPPPAAGKAAARPTGRALRHTPPASGSHPAEPPGLRRAPVTPEAEAVAMSAFGARRDEADASPPPRPTPPRPTPPRPTTPRPTPPRGARRSLILAAVILVMLIAALALWLGILGGGDATVSLSLTEPDRATAQPPIGPDSGAAAPDADLAPDPASLPRTDAAPATATAPRRDREPAATADPQPTVANQAVPPAPDPARAAPATAAPATATADPDLPVAGNAANPAPASVTAGAVPATEAAAAPEPEPASVAPPPPLPDATAPTATVAAGPQPDAPGAPAITAATAVAALGAPRRFADAAAAEPAPHPLPLPPAFGKLVRYDPQGLIVATPDGVVTPAGFTLVAGQPPRRPAPRPETIAAAAAALAKAARSAPQPDPAAGGGETIAAPSAPVDPAHAALTPRRRPAAVVERAASVAAGRAAAEAAARAEAEARAAAIASATAQAVASSRRPVERPQSFSRAVEVALAAAAAADTAAEAAAAPAVAAPVTEELDEPEPTVTLPASSRTTVARQATLKNAINLGEMNLIGVYGSAASRRALVRMPNGRYLKLRVGDRFDGGQVAAIGDSELRYVKNGRTLVLKILKNS